MNSTQEWTNFHTTAVKQTHVSYYEVETITFDSYVQENGLAPDFVKIDAEGSEQMIIQGMEQTIREFSPLISMEVGDKDIEGVLSSRELVLLLKGKGYRVYEEFNSSIVEHQLKDRYSTGNLFFARDSG